MALSPFRGRGFYDVQAEMNRTRMTGDLDRDFVAMMVPHHQAAVDRRAGEQRPDRPTVGPHQAGLGLVRRQPAGADGGGRHDREEGGEETESGRRAELTHGNAP